MCFTVIIRAPPTSCIPVSVRCLGEDSLSSRVHPLNDKMVQNHLLLCPLYNVLLHTALGHQSVDVHLCGMCVECVRGWGVCGVCEGRSVCGVWSVGGGGVCVECGVCEGVECVWSV